MPEVNPDLQGVATKVVIGRLRVRQVFCASILISCEQRRLRCYRASVLGTSDRQIAMGTASSLRKAFLGLTIFMVLWMAVGGVFIRYEAAQLDAAEAAAQRENVANQPLWALWTRGRRAE